MDAQNDQYFLSRPDISWSEDTSPQSEDIEEVVRQSSPQLIYTHTVRPRTSRPVRKRLESDKSRTKSYQTFALAPTTMDLDVKLQVDSRNGFEGDEVSSPSVVTIVTSTTSSVTDPWTPIGFVEEMEVEDEEANYISEDEREDQEDELVVPKIEPADDHLDIADVGNMQDSVVPIVGPQPPEIPAKRPRGRPKKNPKADVMSKVTKGRTKTGCITCRKRKKKCDETKPGCGNCEKNGTICEGYAEKTMWKSGREKAEEARLRRVSSLPRYELPPIVLGIETNSDSLFLQHYMNRLSTKFTVEGEGDTVFRTVLLKVALTDIGLMHSILSLSSKHLDYDSAYGRQLLLEHKGLDVKTLEARSEYHYDQATKALLSRREDESSDPLYCQIVCSVLQTLSDKNPKGYHRVHLNACNLISRSNPPTNTDVAQLTYEFFHYHFALDDLIRLPDRDPDGSLIKSNFANDMNLPTTIVQPQAVHLLGVFDGLFIYISRITNLRNQIRENLKENHDPIIDYHILTESTAIEAGIRDWKPVWGPRDPRELAGQLNRHMVWIYLFRTMTPPRVMGWKLDPRIVNAVDYGIELLALSKPNDSSQTLLLAPTFVIGCAAFVPAQRPAIRKAIGVIKAYMEYKNADLALEVLEEVWKLMDLKDERSWDWQSIAWGMGLDFLAT